MENRHNSITRRRSALQDRTGPRIPPGRPAPLVCLPRSLSQEELRRFYKAVRANGSLRDLALFGLIYRFGLLVN